MLREEAEKHETVEDSISLPSPPPVPSPEFVSQSTVVEPQQEIVEQEPAEEGAVADSVPEPTEELEETAEETAVEAAKTAEEVEEEEVEAAAVNDNAEAIDAEES